MKSKAIKGHKRTLSKILGKDMTNRYGQSMVIMNEYIVAISSYFAITKNYTVVIRA